MEEWWRKGYRYERHYMREYIESWGKRRSDWEGGGLEGEGRGGGEGEEIVN